MPLKWEDDEIKILKENYTGTPKEEILSLLPKRTWCGIMQKARKIGLNRGPIGLKHINWKIKEVGKNISQKAYIAGFLDADGSICLVKRSKSIRPTIEFSSTNKEVLKWLRNVLDVKVYNSKHVDKRSKRYKPQYHAVINDFASILSLLKSIKEYMITKKKQAETVIEFLEIRMRKLEKNYHSPCSEVEWELYRKIKELNARGS